MNYQIGHVYKILCTVNSEFVYIGSTFLKLNARWDNHKYKYNKYLKGGINNMSTYKYYDKYGIQFFRIVLIKSYKVCRESQTDYRHLRAFEQLWINKTKRSINYNNAFNPLAKLDKNIYQNKYYENNKEEISEKMKEWRKKNKEKINKREREKITCECGTIITRSNLSTHKKTKKHIKLMQRYNKLKMLLLL